MLNSDYSEWETRHGILTRSTLATTNVCKPGLLCFLKSWFSLNTGAHIQHCWLWKHVPLIPSITLQGVHQCNAMHSKFYRFKATSEKKQTSFSYREGRIWAWQGWKGPLTLSPVSPSGLSSKTQSSWFQFLQNCSEQPSDLYAIVCPRVKDKRKYWAPLVKHQKTYDNNAWWHQHKEQGWDVLSPSQTLSMIRSW